MSLDNKTGDNSDVLRDARYTGIVMSATVIVGMLLAGVIAYQYGSHFGDIEADHERWGQFGDYFGGTLNPIFSFLGLIAIVFTLRLQISQLRQSLSDNAKQAQRADLVQFQASFFQLLDLHNKIVSDSFISTGLGYDLRGRDAFRLVWARLQNAAARKREGSSDDILKMYEDLYIKNEDLLAHYFRNLYHIMKFIDMNVLVDRQYYADVLRAQLSASEASLLFYNGLSQWGIKRAKPLIEKYGLLKTLPTAVVLPPDLVEDYDPQAFRKGFIEAQLQR